MKLRLSCGHIGRNVRPSHIGIERFEQLVTHRAARKRAAGCHTPRKFSQDLADLLIQIKTGDEQHLQPAAAGQFAIARQEHAALSPRQPHQLMIIEGRIKNRIVTEDTQPLG